MRKVLIALVMMAGCATYFGDDDDQVRPDAAIAVDADTAPTCEWRKCGEPPHPPNLTGAVFNGDGTVTLPRETFDAIRLYVDTSSAWSSCRTFYDEQAVCE
jgi:hypothetical protein